MRSLGVGALVAQGRCTVAVGLPALMTVGASGDGANSCPLKKPERTTLGGIRIHIGAPVYGHRDVALTGERLWPEC